MKTTTPFIFFALLLTLGACNNFEDAAPTNRNSLIRFYSASKNVEGTIAEVDTDGGYIIAGNIILTQDADEKDILIIKTDADGNKLWEKIIDKGQVNALLIAETGYIIAGTRIQINRESSEATEIENTQARFITMSKEGTIANEAIVSQTVNIAGKELNIDYAINGLTVDAAGNLLVLASQDSPVEGSFRKSVLLAFAPSSTIPVWLQDDYFLEDRDYLNCNSLQIAPNGNLLWATTTRLQQSSISEQYVSVGFAPPNSTFDNSDTFGENDARNHSSADLQPSTTGYGIVGTYAQSNGANANMYFVRVNNSGSVIENSARYFDGESILLTNRDESFREDQGKALTGTADGGFVLAGTTVTENGDDDILLVKLDAAGNLVWHKQYGGTGNEQPTSIRETSDKGLLVCGTNTVRGQSSIMLVKTDLNGNVEN
jgi:hypothetical protein